MNRTNQINIKVIVIAIILLIFLIIDILLGIIFINNSTRTFRSNHSFYHHGLVPNQKAVAQWNNIRYPFYTNSLGFRDSIVQEIPLDTHKKRILFMGDSHTEGVGMSFEDTFTGQLLEKIDTSEIEILNAAAVSYSPRIHYLKTKYLLEDKGLKFDELFVFVDISDIQNEIVYEDFQPEVQGNFRKLTTRIRDFAINRSFALHTINFFRKKNQTVKFLQRANIFDEHRESNIPVDALELYATFFRDYSNEVLLSNPNFHGVSSWIYDEDFKDLAYKGLELGKQNLLQLVELCKNAGIKMHISIHPWQEQIIKMDPEDLFVRFWKDFAEENEIGFINMYPEFINPPVSAALGMEFYIKGDNHWNKNGHWLAATILEKYIHKNKQHEKQ